MRRCRASMAHTRQSRPDPGLGFQITFVGGNSPARESCRSGVCSRGCGVWENQGVGFRKLRVWGLGGRGCGVREVGGVWFGRFIVWGSGG